MSPKTIYMVWILGFAVAVVVLAGVLLMLNRIDARKTASNFEPQSLLTAAPRQDGRGTKLSKFRNASNDTNEPDWEFMN
jgi:hypothetical protein